MSKRRPEPWWEACRELGLGGYDAFSPEGANFNGSWAIQYFALG
jgi:hypothetical protein